MHRITAHVRRVLRRLFQRRRPGEGPDLLGSGVPRRPSPGGLVASTAAKLEPDSS